MNILVVVLSIITALNLLVTYGLVRRIRVHSDLLEELVGATTARALPVGTPIPAFTTHAIDGSRLADTDLRHPAAIALFAVDCPHCRTNLPDFIAYIQGAGYARDHVLAMVTTRDATDPMVEMLTPTTTLVCEPNSEGAVATAFGIQAYPTFYLTDDNGVITAATHAVRQLPNTTKPDLARP
ncbi:redoxin domain-containing protein [Nocardia arthritidis]|uniref:Redoxin domain-containing protein n=1 Tax=Nocardia arthritidis TaxID=228602 RepID=A0A6G9YQ43_9NOCA|nr:redoxin domain-containing protein [Nocardia arthritidis]QIS15136.1 redoxin domain-containing protein [Nocardia arthritidis]